jgi:photosystem II protein
MNAKIEFIEGVKEKVLPIIKLTKSRNGKTGTGTFIFINPDILKSLQNSNSTLEGISLLWENQKMETKTIEIFFKKGKPFLIKAIFIFKNSKEWFKFLNFMNYYSKETGLLFTDKNFLNYL